MVIFSDVVSSCSSLSCSLMMLGLEPKVLCWFMWNYCLLREVLSKQCLCCLLNLIFSALAQSQLSGTKARGNTFFRCEQQTVRKDVKKEEMANLVGEEEEEEEEGEEEKEKEEREQEGKLKEGAVAWTVSS